MASLYFLFYTTIVIKTASTFSLSAVDGRYSSKTAPLADIFSESNLITNRLKIEIDFLLFLSKKKLTRNLTNTEKRKLLSLKKLTPKQILEIKKIENKTHHDVKAVEYFLRNQIKNSSLKDLSPYIHIGLTSEDINNLAYRLMVKDGLQDVLIPELIKAIKNLTSLAEKHIDQPILARTHGQGAIPTTFGKEIAVFINRLIPLLNELHSQKLKGKLNGAVGGYQALSIAFPKKNWLKLNKEFVKSYDLEFLEISTQINPQDDLVILFQKLFHINQVLIGLNQDLWRYVSDDWLLQKNEKSHVGSSTMPQKINPIEFENSEGNLKMANGMFQVFIQNFTISRLQRDLSDSTIQRNIGTSFGHCLLAYQSLNKGLEKIEINKKQIKVDLNKNWNILAEAAQTMARKNGDDKAYEKIAEISKNQTATKEDWQKIVKNIDKNLLELNPENYLGLSKQITKNVINKSHKLIRKVQQ